MEYHREPHKVYSLIYHLIFVVKYLQHVFLENSGIDHVHLLISAKPTLDIPKYINIIKGHSSRFLRKEYKSFLGDKLWGNHFWSPSYFIASTGNVSIDVLKQYVEKQRRRVALEN